MRLRTGVAIVSAVIAPTAAFAIMAPRPSFGAPYSVVQDATMRPVVAGNVLRVPVRFNGGCASHDFQPVYRQQTMGPIVWLVHTTTDHCATVQTQWVTIPLTQDTHTMHLVWLFTPDGQHLQIQVP